MKKTLALLLTFIFCIFICSCAPVSPANTIKYNDGASKIYYNGHTYINTNNTNGKYIFNNHEDEYWVEIATMPYGIFYILDAVTAYYGNHKEKPDFITNSRTIDFYVREDLTFNHNTELFICDEKTSYNFKISEVTTGNVIEYRAEKEESFIKTCNFVVSFEKYPFIQQRIAIYKYGDKFYLQDVWDSDYYEITKEFEEDIFRLGINNLDDY